MNAMPSPDNVSIVRHWVEEYWNNGNEALVEPTFSPDYIGHFPRQSVSGHDGIKAFGKTYRTAFPDVRFSLEDLIALGDRVVWRYTARGTHRGEIGGIPATGKPAVVTGIIISRFENGKWAEDWGNFDELGMLQQLGVVPVVNERQYP